MGSACLVQVGAHRAGGSQQGPTLDPGLVTRLAEVVDYFLEKKASILLSNATTRNKDEPLQLLRLREHGAAWDKKPEDADLPDFTSHEWLAGGEDSADNREAYMKYLKCRVALPDNYSVMDVQPNRNLLSTPLANTGRTIRGTTDVVVAQSSNIQNNAVRNNVEALLGLKKPENLRQTDHCPQAVVEHLAASQLNDNVGVVSFLTDLTNSWTVFWFGWSEYEPGVVLYKLQLHEAKAGPLALFILKNLNNKSMRELLPATFSDRLSFKEVLRQIQLANDNPKRQRMSPGSGNGGGSSEQGTSSTPEPAQRHTSSGPANESTGRSQPQGGQADQCSNTLTVMDKAYVLRRLAPRYNDDVADELDLLDMVDQSEQLEIIRSFAMKHIVPHMYGDYVL